ncbi:hypothetical protein [Paraburkholderia strydomiana]|uniref:hypothetical protein n=1 Tax=Paraburkholderia strydomiana TaxID=1245417 RepID=UPI0038BB00B8
MKNPGYSGLEALPPRLRSARRARCECQPARAEQNERRLNLAQPEQKWRAKMPVMVRGACSAALSTAGAAITLMRCAARLRY